MERKIALIKKQNAPAMDPKLAETTYLKDNLAQHSTMLPKFLGQHTRVDTPNTRDAMLGQPIGQGHG